MLASMARSMAIDRYVRAVDATCGEDNAVCARRNVVARSGSVDFAVGHDWELKPSKEVSVFVTGLRR